MATVTVTLPKTSYQAGERLEFQVNCDNSKVPKPIVKIKVSLDFDILNTKRFCDKEYRIAFIKRMKPVAANAVD